MPKQFFALALLLMALSAAAQSTLTLEDRAMTASQIYHIISTFFPGLSQEKFDAAFLDAMPQGSVEMARFLDEEVRPQEHEADEAGSLTSTGWPPLHPAG